MEIFRLYAYYKAYKSFEVTTAAKQENQKQSTNLVGYTKAVLNDEDNPSLVDENDRIDNKISDCTRKYHQD